jgi:tetratricopeptide (TPR) repeat protein
VVAGLIYGLAGLMGGLCLAATIALVNLGLVGVLRPARRVSITPHVVHAVTPTSAGPLQVALERARDELNLGNPENVKVILLPVLSEFESDEDLALAYKLLAEAEIQQDHYEMGAGYLESVYRYAPSAENLFELAAAYDTGGDLEMALEKYQQLLALSDPQAAQYRSSVEQRVADLGRVLKRPTQTP